MKPLSLHPISRTALDRFGLAHTRGARPVRSPITGETIAHVEDSTPQAVDETIARASDAFLRWRLVPAPRRGQLVREFGEALRSAKRDLAEIVATETGKITTE